MNTESFMASNFQQFWELTGFANATWQHLVMPVSYTHLDVYKRQAQSVDYAPF